MILPYMTQEEMLSSYMRDKEVLDRALSNAAKEFGSRCRKSRTFPFFSIKEYHSSHGENNDYLFIFMADKRGEWCKPRFSVLCKYRTPEGVGVFFQTEIVMNTIFERKVDHFDFLTPHFIRRYAERKLGNIMMPEKDVIREYFTKETGTLALASATTEFIRPEGRYANQENMLVMPLSEGAAVVQNRTSRYSVYVTYLGKQQLKDNQKGFVQNRSFFADILNPFKDQPKGRQYRVSLSHNNGNTDRAEVLKENSIDAYTFFYFCCLTHLKELNGLSDEQMDSPHIMSELREKLEKGFSEDRTVWTADDGMVIAVKCVN